MMARKGRQSKPGKRHPSGKLVQRKAKPVDPTAKIVEARRRFGTYYCTAYGRMYASGFMGDEATAKGRYEGAEHFLRVYAAVYGSPGYHCPLDQSPKGRGMERENPFAEQDRNWLREVTKQLDDAGCYAYLEQILSLANVTDGPTWLDALLDVQLWNRNLAKLNARLKELAIEHKTEFKPKWPKAYAPEDQMVADLAVKALDILAPDHRAIGIVSARYENAA